MGRQQILHFAIAAMLIVLQPLVALVPAVTLPVANVPPSLQIPSAEAVPLSVVTLYADRDAWIDFILPDANYGSETVVFVGSSECPGIEFPSRGRGLFHFDLSPLPRGATIVSATFGAYVRHAGTPNAGVALPIGVHRLQGNWIENGVTWNTQPQHSAAYVSASVSDNTLAFQSWDVTRLAQEWYQGTFPNDGLMLISAIESLTPPANCGSRAFDSREYTAGHDAQLVINYTTTSPTVCADLSMDAVEITQAIQDNGNSVPLVANKRTYARAHVRSAGAPCPGVLAEFFVNLGRTLLPDNPGARITVRASPDTGVLNDSFFVELPPEYLDVGFITVCAIVNPDRAVLEPNYGNNGFCNNGNFASSPPVRVRIYDVRFWDSSTLRTTSFLDQWLLVSWLRRAYPTSEVQYSFRTLNWTGAKLPAQAGCEAVNNALATQRKLDGSPDRWRYYGMVTDASGFMRGCAMGTPSKVASGPTGVPAGSYGWDVDGSYGDWYGGHELGHTYGRTHANFCGAPDGGSYPYPNGVIGGPATTPTRFRGFDIEQRVVYPASWTDVMTYCANEWISDFTYKGIRDRLILEETALVEANATRPSTTDVEQVLVVGLANSKTGVAQLGTLYRRFMPTSEIPTGNGQWQLALYHGNTPLQAWAFTPKADTDPGPAEEFDASILEAVPWLAGTTKVAILYQGQAVAERSVSAHAPAVRVVAPNGGETLNSSLANVQWTGTDADGDLLRYSVQYSPDAGASWQTLVTDYNLTQYSADMSHLPGSTIALFRVIASDGVNTGEDQSDRVFTVYKKAPLPIISSPIGDTCLVQGQQLMLVGDAYDFEDGPLTGSQLTWSADFQANLGAGRQMSINDAPLGRHSITLRATDSDGMSTTVSRTFRVLTSGCAIYKIYLPLILINWRSP